MKIELTVEQFNLIQDECIRLENMSQDEDLTGWAFIEIRDKIETLRTILRNEEIDLDLIS